jgi:ABC-type transport system substrate-binding protein
MQEIDSQPFKKRKWPTKNQWSHFWHLLKKKERIFFISFASIFVASLIFVSVSFINNNTQVIPRNGGNYSEGIVGSPRFINPVYAATSDADRDLTELIFSGLVKFDPNGEITEDLVESYRILDDGKTYEFTLKRDIVWHDGEPLTTDDILFTIQTLQDSEIKSPLRGNWLGVNTEKLSDHVIRFTIDKPSSVFLQNCTVKIIPKHIWGKISPKDFPLSEFNLNAVGSGPYKIEKIEKDKNDKFSSIKLVRNDDYFGKKPYINTFTFDFFSSEKELISKAREGAFKGMAVSVSEKRSFSSMNLYSISMPRYFAIFFNQDGSKILDNINIRKALNYAIDKNKVLEEILGGEGITVNSPILPEIYGFNQPKTSYDFNVEKALELLEEEEFNLIKDGQRVKDETSKTNFTFTKTLTKGSSGNEVTKLQECLANANWVGEDVYPNGKITGYYGNDSVAAVNRFQEKYAEDILIPSGLTEGTGSVKAGTREKLNELCFPEEEVYLPLNLVITTADQPLLIETAENIKKQLKDNIQANVEINIVDINTLEREIIKPREYESILFGEILGATPDLFPFWHSTMVKDPGLNLSLFSDKKADKLIEETRQLTATEDMKDKLEQFQEIVLEEAPAIFLFNPNYLYFVSKNIKGIETSLITDPSNRFSGVENWYIKTKRSF